jgi:CubicO group peptidase (beta-lactamase class C family)
MLAAAARLRMLASPCSDAAMRPLPSLLLLAAAALLSACASAPPSTAQVDAAVADALRRTQARGLAIALVEGGQVRFARAYGERNAAGAPLTPETVMYGASLTKTVFAHFVLQLVDEGKLALDTPIAHALPKPLPEYPNERGYGPWADLANEPRWRQLTPRILLTHSAGFSNFAFDEPDRKLRMHFDPGSRYAYSGEGLILLQFVIARGLGLDVGAEMQRRVFDRFGMKTTSMTWRPDFAQNLADGWDAQGRPVPHDQRSRVRAAGSMDTTMADIAAFAAGLVRGEGLSAASRAELTRPQLPIGTATQFPSLQPELPPAQRRADLAAGLGLIVFRGPQGPGFFKGGHNDSTGNTLVCVAQGQRCVVILANDVRAEPAFPRLVRLLLGETGVPWRWEYGAMEFLP